MKDIYKFSLFTILLFFVFSYVDQKDMSEIIERLDGRILVYKVLFFANYIGLLLSCFIFLTVKSKLVRYVFYCLLFLTTSITLATLFAHGNSFGKFEANIMFTEIQFASLAASAFYLQYLKGLIIGILITILLAFISSHYFPPIDNSYIFIPLIFIAYSVKIHINSESWHTKFPSVFNVPILASDAYFSIPRFGPREEPFMQPEKKGLFKHIFWIIDESVRGDILSLNNYNKPTTPFLDSIKTNFYNLGIASSASTYSLASNIILQSGLRMDQLPDKKLKYGTNPNIFQYSKQAGYSTYFIDGQKQTDLPTNAMTRFDYKFIDNYISIHKIYPEIKWHEVDTTLISFIDKIMKVPKNTFTYINKAGCHFAYNKFYPTNREVFQPSYREGISWTNRTALINTYCNCIKWSVDDFFRKLYPTMINKDAIVIYTSDHGVTLMENGRPVQDTDPKNPLPSRANSPLMVFTGEQNQELFKFSKNNKNKLSHFSIFPSTLLLLGYNELKITQLYGENFFMKREFSRRFFFSGAIYDPEEFYLHEFK